MRIYCILLIIHQISYRPRRGVGPRFLSQEVMEFYRTEEVMILLHSDIFSHLLLPRVEIVSDKYGNFHACPLYSPSPSPAKTGFYTWDARRKKPEPGGRRLVTSGILGVNNLLWLVVYGE